MTGAPRWAEAWTGIPFDRSRSFGLDCWGLVREVLKARAGLELPQYDDVDPHDMRAVARAMGDIRVPHRRVTLAELRELDVVQMQGWVRRDDDSPRLTRAMLHVGIAVSPVHILHVEEATDSVVVPVTHPSIGPRIVAAYRYAMETAR